MRLADGVVVTDTDDGLVLLHQRSGTFWQANGSGRTVVQLLLANAKESEIVARLVDRYEVSADQAEADVTGLVAQLHAAKLVIG
jgi:hypothetical protein